ncbi:ubiquitin carboxyl-terminal hydrolase-domain-containing protein [Neohortaea acidophila]|uniref:PAN2-PAN3 deadenylation complex catalytic subunit PAN2 n=1 Tax=Neohortaea acidophila TaxID=245834 RepID=A0A6A6Q1A7_9PEZI|nr:ubiquitin carboxyl-terminal hydrolase-domain-containing protein [Neohortaea acidophila]KAF2485463.1 ubiquitin carboxyl-terminal hydrolase-domain-containing protein [Neohortaea acidophila]
MEADWNETARITLPGPTPNAASGLITTFAFDTVQDLLWTGNEYGRITSFYGAELQRHTSYRGHDSTAGRGARGSAAVKQLLFCQKGILSISPRSVHLSNRRGLTLWHISQSDMVDLRCMSFTTAAATEVVVAGCQRDMYRIDVEKGTIIETLAHEPHIAFTLMRWTNQYICAASHDGSIHLLDTKTLSLANSWKAYAGTVNDMDARGDYLLTCGWAQQQYQGLALERLVRVFNLKTQKSVAPVTFSQGAAFVRMHPKLSSTCIVVSQMGAVQSIDVQNPDIPVMRFVQTFDAQLTGLELMPSGKGFAMADSHCQITLWGSPAKLQFTEFTQPIEMPDAAAPVKNMDWSPDVALNLIGMPFYREALLSGWSNGLVHEVGAPPSKMDGSMFTGMRKFEHGLVGPNLHHGRRYEVTDTRSLLKDPNSIPAPKFLSEQKKDEDGHYEIERRFSEDIGKTLKGLTLQDSPPLYYQRQKMAYSRFGVDDFDFRYFNHTPYSGLEIHIVNSYANPLLQVFRFANVIRNLALQHTAMDCRLEHCMLCETGFVVDMLEKAHGLICQATNFFKALSKQPNAAALAFLEEHTLGTPMTVMIQNLTRFLLPALEENSRRVSGHPGEVQLALGTFGRAYSTCTACLYEDAKQEVWFSQDLVYPKGPKHTQRAVRPYFSRLLKDSVERYDQHRGWCMRCQSYKAIRSRRALMRTPDVLMINAAIHTNDARHLWATPGFLPKEIGIIVHDDQFYCYEGQDLQLHLQRQIHDITVYTLVGVIAEVTTNEAQPSHLISMIDVGVSNPPDSTQGENWHLFNDFMVRPISGQEALHFDPRWKLPSVLTYQAKQMSHFIDESWKSKINTNILFRSVAQPAFSPAYEFRALSSTDAFPSAQSHYAIDAEFVRLLREEIDMDADGRRAITRPARSGLARVSVVRGDEPDQALPFMDDYIALDEPVDDYLTQYSGLHDGDLTWGVSKFTLVRLKEVYKKLWVLLNLGCTFIGHGLSSDFRTINIHVPEAQVIDTQDLFSLGERSRRKLSLRFLAWLILGEDIQQNITAGHDSIEDARAALKLWRKYLEYAEAGILEQIKDEVFVKGKATDFKVPARDGRLLQPDTPLASSAPGTPERRIAAVARVTTPARSEFGSPFR